MDSASTIIINVKPTIHDHNMQSDSVANHCHDQEYSARNGNTLKKIPPAASEYSVPFRWEESPGRPIIVKPNIGYSNFHPNNNMINYDYYHNNPNPYGLSSISSMKNCETNNKFPDYCNSNSINYCSIMRSSNTAALNLPPKLQYYYYCYNNHLYHQSNSSSKTKLDRNKKFVLISPQINSKVNKPITLSPKLSLSDQISRNIHGDPKSKIPTNLHKSLMEYLKGDMPLDKDPSPHDHHQHHISINLPVNPSDDMMNRAGDDYVKKIKDGVYIHDRFFFNDKLSKSLDLNLMRCNIVSSTLDSWNLMDASSKKAYNKKNDSMLDSAWTIHDKYGQEGPGSKLEYSPSDYFESLDLMVNHGREYGGVSRRRGGSKVECSQDPLVGLDMASDYDDECHVPAASPWILGFSPNLASSNHDESKVNCINILRRNSCKIKSQYNKKNIMRNHQVYTSNQLSMRISNRLLRLATLAKLRAMLGRAISTVTTSSCSTKERKLKSKSCAWLHAGQGDHMWSPTLATYLYNQQIQETTLRKARLLQELSEYSCSSDDDVDAKPSNVGVGSKLAEAAKECRTTSRLMDDIVGDAEPQSSVFDGEHGADHERKPNPNDARVRHSSLAKEPAHYSLGIEDIHEPEKTKSNELKNGTHTNRVLMNTMPASVKIA